LFANSNGLPVAASTNMVPISGSWYCGQRRSVIERSMAVGHALQANPARRYLPLSIFSSAGSADAVVGRSHCVALQGLLGFGVDMAAQLAVARVG